jgi:hypothetical protein
MNHHFSMKQKLKREMAQSRQKEKRDYSILKEWSQQFAVLLSMNVIYKITGLAVWLTTQGATTASAARHGVVGVVTALSGGERLLVNACAIHLYSTPPPYPQSDV